MCMYVCTCRDYTDYVVVDRVSLALKSATTNKVKTLHEAVGFALLTLLLMTLFIASLYIWVRDFARPLATYLPAGGISEK